MIDLWLNSGSRDGGLCVFQAYKMPDGHWSVKYMHPLSCFQVYDLPVPPRISRSRASRGGAGPRPSWAEPYL